MIGNKINKIIWCFCIILFCISCNKNKKQNNDIHKFISQLVDLKTYKITEKKINDTIVKIMGTNTHYLISGYLNKKNNKKDSKWSVKFNTKKKQNLLNIEYIIFDNKEFINQYKLYEENKINLKKSKFYKNNIAKQNYNIYFNLPLDDFDSGNITYKYFIVYMNKVIASETLDAKINTDNKFNFTINVGRYPNFDYIKGIFSEYYEKKIGDSVRLTTNQIYTEYYRNPDYYDKTK